METILYNLKTNKIIKQTAVEWLCEQYHLKQDIEIVKQAKEMEKQQIVDAVDETISEMNLYESYRTLQNGEQYYKETFAKQVLAVRASPLLEVQSLNNNRMKEYRKTATVNAKLFEKGDEDGMIHKDGMLGAMEDAKYGFEPDLVPYISTIENQFHRGEFGKHYMCVGIKGEKWLVEKSIFEATYEVV